MSAVQVRDPWLECIEAPSLRNLRREVGRAHRRGELAASGPIHRLEHGGYYVQVYRLKARHPRAAWRRPVLVVGSVALVLAAAAAAGWWATSLLLPAPLLGGGAALLAVRLVARRRGCVTTVTVVHRRG